MFTKFFSFEVNRDNVLTVIDALSEYSCSYGLNVTREPGKLTDHYSIKFSCKNRDSGKCFEKLLNLINSGINIKKLRVD